MSDAWTRTLTDVLDIDDDNESPARISVFKWAIWTELMGYVSIGDLYDKCGEKSTIAIFIIRFFC